VNSVVLAARVRYWTEELHDMNAPMQAHRDYGFVIGLFAGAFVGAGVLMWLAPRTGSELRRRATESARRLSRRATEQYQQASTQVGDAIDELRRKAQDVRDDAADAVARGAHEVERVATAAKTERVPDARKHSAAPSGNM
jgi:gas vesicle protein